MVKYVFLGIIFLFFSASPAISPANLEQLAQLNGLSLSAQWFLSYQQGESEGSEFSAFQLKRGYIDIKKAISENFSARITPDISVDGEGDGMGDIEMRLKYCYIKYIFDDNAVLAKPNVEFGVVHRPWLDFEQKINQYRVQGTMFMERVKVFNSADYGVTFQTLLGGKVDSEYQKTVNKNYPGRYGSLALGIYNGAGYHAIEKNMNKTVEGRLTLRPLPDFIPGLQLSYTAAFGKANLPSSPDFDMSAVFLSMEHRNFVATGTWLNSVGTSGGKYLNTVGESIRQTGYSTFLELRNSSHKISLIGRYDRQLFNDGSNTEYERVIAGIAWFLTKGSKILLDYDVYKHVNSDEIHDKIFEFAIELRY